jgi:hypothetical protein
MDNDLENMGRDYLIAEVKKLRADIRSQRDASGHDLCWYHPHLWALLPDKFDPAIAVPPWDKFLRGWIQYRSSLDLLAPAAPVHDMDFDGSGV